MAGVEAESVEVKYDRKEELSSPLRGLGAGRVTSSTVLLSTILPTR